MTVLLIGGAGYVGSAIAYHLLDRGHDVVVFDNLSTGSRDAVPAGVKLIQGDCGERGALTAALQGVAAVIQLAAAVRVDESVADPAKYYFNNTVKSLTVFDACAKAGIKDFVFSSTAAVYGSPQKTLIDEATPTEPVNPYGHSKLACEFMLKDIARVSGMRATILRYFNVAGADTRLRTGQRTAEATHLIKVASEVAIGKREVLEIYGTDYPTPDGTAVRDYIHVMDLALAHELALLKPGQPGEPRVYNCGYGTGHSVRQVVDAFGKALNHPLATRESGRRAGDAAALACDAAKLKRELEWVPANASLATIVESALNWERKLSAAHKG